jgi:VanZ like family
VRQGLVLAVIAAAICASVQVARRRAVAAPSLLVLSVGGAAAVSLFQLGFDGAANAGIANCWATFEPGRWISSTYSSAQGLANICLYVSVGFFAWLTLRRLTLAATLPCALSVGVELLQAFGGAHDCSPDDVIANVTGGLIGVTIGVMGSSSKARFRPRRAAQPATHFSGPNPDHRQLGEPD